jgi:hypothetical protein
MMRMSHSSDLCYVTERSEAPGLNLCYVTDRSFDPIYLWPSISPSAARTSRSISATSCAPKCGSRSQNARPFRLDLGGWDKLAARAAFLKATWSACSRTSRARSACYTRDRTDNNPAHTGRAPLLRPLGRSGD